MYLRFQLLTRMQLLAVCGRECPCILGDMLQNSFQMMLAANFKFCGDQHV